MEKNLLSILLVGLLVAGIFATTTMAPQRAFAATANSFITVDLSGTLNPNDFPYGIDCSADANYVYMAIYNQGIIAKIDKNTKQVVALLDDTAGPVTDGQGFYSISNDSNGNLFINERNNGKVWKYSTAGDTWTEIPIVEQITGNPKVTYPNGFTRSPNIIRIDENPDPRGVVTYQVAMQSFGGVVYANSAIYVGLAYHADFADSALTNAGVADLDFHGLAKIDPSSNTVTRISIPGAQQPTGMKVDGSTIWITDRGLDKVYKYDASSDTVTATISLASGSSPRGIDVDNNYVYVALNKAGPGNSEIVKISKTDTTQQTTIDTGASIGTLGSGTFSVFVANGNLIWTDEAGHIGSVNLSNGASAFDTTTFANDNRNGCLVGSEFWWAAHGSAKVGTMPLSDLQVQGSGSNLSHAQMVAAYTPKATKIVNTGLPDPMNCPKAPLTAFEVGIANPGTLGAAADALGIQIYQQYGLRWDQLTWDQIDYMLYEMLYT